jgi:3-(3-hydroxy-phenyl)propionate hydroxylase
MPDGVTALRLPAHGPAATRYAATEGDTYLLRPDQHVAARWHGRDPTTIAASRRRALGFTGEGYD